MMTLAPPRPAPVTGPGPFPRATTTRTSARASGFYRHDLDGLRGIAILLVAVFHVWFGRVSGGVDVFLVLSGFFFGGRLLRQAAGEQSDGSLPRAIVRLVRRLAPALVVVLAASAVLTVLVQPQTRWGAFAEDGARLLRNGGTLIDAIKPCTRCVITTTDQETGERGREPLRTLATYRTGDGGLLFGQNCVPRTVGTLSVGDPVEVVESR